MKSPLFLFRLLAVCGFVLLMALPPLARHAYAGDDSDNNSITASNHPKADDDADDDDDQNADRNNGDSDQAADKDDDDDAHQAAGKDDDDDDDDGAPETRMTPVHRTAPVHEVPLAAVEVPAPPADGHWWHPHPGTSWQVQYVGLIDTETKVDAFDLDLFDTDPAVIKKFHARGVKVICYFSAGSYEGWRPDIKKFPKSVLGRGLSGWKYERWLDIRKIGILEPIMKARIALAKEKGCDAIDPDNVEGYDNKTGFPLTGRDQIAYDKMLSGLAHGMGMAAELKNDVDQVEQLLPWFDFQVNEQCFEYHSCDEVVPFIKANKPVFNIEYNVAADQFCPEANKLNFDSLKKDLDLGPKTHACR